MSSGLECNIEEVFEKFMNLTTQEMNKAVRSGLRAGAKELQKQTKANAKAGIKTHGNTAYYNGQIITYNDEVEDAVMISKIDGDFGEELSQKVHVMGRRKSGSQTYKFRFLERGTKERYAKHYRDKNGQLQSLKKPRYLGRIDGRWYFKNAQSSVLPQLQNIYMRKIDETINKLNNTKI